jgi:hypothetical protein
MQRSILVFCTLVLVGCGATAGSEARSLEEQVVWSPALLAKLDAPLRTRVEHPRSHERIPVHVFFRELPSDDVLAELLLNRIGEQAIGNVEPDTLYRIASRSDVDRIEELDDVGYSVQ